MPIFEGKKEFYLSLGKLANDDEFFTIHEFTTALRTTQNLEELQIDFDDGRYDPIPANNRLMVASLCHCIANLRDHNEHHPLRRLWLYNYFEEYREGYADVVDQFLVAAKQFGIRDMKVTMGHSDCLRVTSLVDFCRDNHHIKDMYIYACIPPISLSPALHDDTQQPQPSSGLVVNLEKLYLDSVGSKRTLQHLLFSQIL